MGRVCACMSFPLIFFRLNKVICYVYFTDAKDMPVTKKNLKSRVV